MSDIEERLVRDVAAAAVVIPILRIAAIQWRLGPPLDRKAMQGHWMAQGGGHVLELAPTGAYSVADESLEVVDRGHWSLRGLTFTLTSSTASTDCAEGDRVVLSGLEHVNTGTTSMRGTLDRNTCGAGKADKQWILIPHGDR